MIGALAEHLETFVRQYLPSGKAWDIKHVQGSNMRKLATAFADEFATSDLSIYEFIQEMMPDTTTNYIDRWERVVGLPDDCFSIAPDIETRRLNVQRKLSLLGLSTREDFEGFATSLGISVKVRSAIDHVLAPNGYGTELPSYTVPGDFATVKAARFTMVVTYLSGIESFDYDFDFPFSSPEQIILECVFRAAKPANVNIIFTSL